MVADGFELCGLLAGVHVVIDVDRLEPARVLGRLDRRLEMQEAVVAAAAGAALSCSRSTSSGAVRGAAVVGAGALTAARAGGGGAARGFDSALFAGVAIGDGATVAEVRYEGERLGEVRVGKSLGEPVTPTEERLLQDLATQAGLVMRNVGLTVDLQARVAQLADQADELRASRMRIVQAHDAERRRLERNIHDGAQQHLVALAVKLRLARGVAGKDPSQAASMLHTLAEETGRARETLLDLASGIYPAALEEHGIAEALRRQGSANGARLAVEADGIGRFPIETEAAVYFVCLEAMQNAAKYAHASALTVTLRRSVDEVTFSVRDDGIGFDPTTVRRGVGMRSMSDRIQTLEGSVEVRSASGRGTVVAARLPLTR